MTSKPRDKEPWPEGLDCRIVVDDIPLDGANFELEAGDAELTAIAARLGIDAIRSFVAQFRVYPDTATDEIKADGRLCADIVQTCGVTLEPLESTVETSFSLRFADLDDGGDVDWEVGEDDQEPAEEIVDGVIDLGDTITQLLAVEIDPFPRSAEAPPGDLSTEAESPGTHPFSGLAALRDKLAE